MAIRSLGSVHDPKAARLQQSHCSCLTTAEVRRLQCWLPRQVSVRDADDRLGVVVPLVNLHEVPACAPEAMPLQKLLASNVIELGHRSLHRCCGDVTKTHGAGVSGSTDTIGRYRPVQQRLSRSTDFRGHHDVPSGSGLGPYGDRIEWTSARCSWPGMPSGRCRGESCWPRGESLFPAVMDGCGGGSGSSSGFCYPWVPTVRTMKWHPWRRVR